MPVGLSQYRSKIKIERKSFDFCLVYVGLFEGVCFLRSKSPRPTPLMHCIKPTQFDFLTLKT